MQARPSLRERVAAGEFVFGPLVVDVRPPTLPLILQAAGFDFFIIDLEHGSLDVTAAADMIAVARLAGIAPLVRPPGHAPEHFRRLLGLGAAGVMVPNVETPQQAEAVVRASKYPPEGVRGFSGNPAQVDFESMGIEGLARRANETTFVMVQIESRTGVANVGDILAVEGIDAVLVGPGDLSLNLGVPGQYDEPAFVEAVESVFAAAHERGVAPGIHCTNPDFARRWRQAGAGLLTYSSAAGLLAAGARAAVEVLSALR